MVVYNLHGEAEDLLAAVDERLLDKEDEEARAKLVRLLRLDLPIWGTLQQHEPPGGKMYGIMREPRARERMQRDELIEQLVELVSILRVVHIIVSVRPARVHRV